MLQPLSSEKIFPLLKKVEKPGRYIGQEINAIVKDLSQVDLKVALVMPETYEIGQSNLGLQILYNILNRFPNVAAERLYAPWVDMEHQLRQAKLSPFSLENKIPLHEFDLIGISLPYELSYTNILTLFDLAGIPRWSKDRQDVFPLILGGGNQAFNPEPVADFFDAFVVGDGEESLVQLVEKLLQFKKDQKAQHQNLSESKQALLRHWSTVQGVYIPSFFQVNYHADQTVAAIEPLFADYPGVKKATVKDLDQASFPTAPIVPSAKTVHDRLAVEVQRGCVRGCRFCQAGYIYRPERQRSPETVLNLIEEGMKQTGAEEVSLLSLSIGDYGCLVPVVRQVLDQYEQQKVSVSLPATRTDTFSTEIIQEIKRGRKTGFTIAPEAGTPRMRRIINKGNSREDLLSTVEKIFKEGWSLIKFYYMCGLPFETLDDLKGIVDEGELALQVGRRYGSRPRIHLSVSPHVPKPHTPFQWEKQDSIEETKRKIQFMRGQVKSKALDFKYHSPEQSYLEGVFARGDRRLAKAIEAAWQLGARFDGWDEKFNLGLWKKAFEQCGLDPDFYVTRERAKEEVFPWDHLFIDLKKEFLWQEREAAYAEGFIHDCSTDRCTFCGICDFHEVKNINYKQDAKDGDVVRFSTRGRKLSTQPFQHFESKKINYGEEGAPSLSLSRVSSYRCRFSKVGEIVFLSHLELVGVLKRALSRAQVPLRFSEGYHPQPKLALTPPTPVGVESMAEYFDIEVEGELHPEMFISQMNRLLPSGIRVLNCEALPQRALSLGAAMTGSIWQMNWIEGYPGGFERLQEKVNWLIEQSECWIDRRREREIKKVDIRPFIEGLEPLSDCSLRLVTRHLTSGSARPQEVLRFLEIPEEKLAQVKITKLDCLLQ